jgi:cysteine/O-acetylserine efflux protein
MANLYPFLAYVIVTTFTPGPNNILSMSHAMRQGYRRTLGFLAGISAGFVLIMLGCGLLNVALLRLLPQARAWLNVLGAAYMVLLAVHLLRAGPMAEGAEQGALNSFGAGFALQFLNVKVILYGVTVFAMFITPAFRDPLPVALFAAALSAVGFASISCWALAGNAFRGLLRRRYRLFNAAMAALLVYTAIAGLLPHA